MRTSTQLILFLISAATLGAQCSITNPSATCPSSGSPTGFTGNAICPVPGSGSCAGGLYAGPPTLESFVAGAQTTMPASVNAVSSAIFAPVIYSGQLYGLSESAMVNDPATCGGNNPSMSVCPFNNYKNELLWIAALTNNAAAGGVGLPSADTNNWMSPIFTTTAYGTACAAYVAGGGGTTCQKILATIPPTIGGQATSGTCASSCNSNATWWHNGLITYNLTLPTLAASGIRNRMAMSLTGDFITACASLSVPSWSTGYTGTTNNYTVQQLIDCLEPAEAAWVIYLHIDDDTVDHEPCGVTQIFMNGYGGCALSVADWNTLTAALATSVRAASQNPEIQIGSGVSYADIGSLPVSTCSATQYWYGIESAPVDFGGVDMYPVMSVVPSAYYSATVANLGALTTCMKGAGKRVWVNESSPLRWAATSCGGEQCTYLGAGDIEWANDGTGEAWLQSVPGTYARAIGVTGFSQFCTQIWLFLSSDPNNDHCSNTGDATPNQYSLNVIGALQAHSGLSVLGKVMQRIASGTAQLFSRAAVNGRAKVQ